MLALGIDPGTAICGYGLVDMQGSRLKAVEYGAILTSPKMRPQDRLLKIHAELTEIIQNTNRMLWAWNNSFSTAT